MHSGSWIFIILLCFVIISSAADPETPIPLNASVGGYVTLSKAVEEEGFLYYEGKIIAAVLGKKHFKNYEENYQKRLHWDQTTGHFNLTGLQKNDSGNYTVDSKTGGAVPVQYNLTVYDDPAENKPAPDGKGNPIIGGSTNSRHHWISIVCVVISFMFGVVVIIVPLIAEDI